MIAESLKKHSNKSIIKYNEIGLKGCKNISGKNKPIFLTHIMFLFNFFFFSSFVATLFE
jgi:hypothetical protein